MNISIVIPNYNGEKILQTNLPKVLEAARTYQKGKVEIIIADDPSTDNSGKVINQFITNVSDSHIVCKTISNKNKRESGFSKNVNRGISLATGDIIVLLNSDVSPHRNFLEPLLARFADPKTFAVGCMDESIENGKTILRGRGVGKWQKGFLMHKKGSIDKDTTLWASGGSSAFRKSIWEKLRGLDVLYNPFYWEDIDLSYRALKSGYKIYFEKSSVVVHEHERGTIKNKFKPVHVRKIAYRNQFIFVWKNITDTELLISHVFWLPYHFINAIRKREWIFFMGFYLACLRFSQIMHERYLAKRLFVLSDKQVIRDHRE